MQLEEYNQHFSSQLQTQLLYFCKCWLVAYRLARLLIAYYSFCSRVKIMNINLVSPLFGCCSRPCYVSGLLSAVVSLTLSPEMVARVRGFPWVCPLYVYNPTVSLSHLPWMCAPISSHEYSFSAIVLVYKSGAIAMDTVSLVCLADLYTLVV